MLKEALQSFDGSCRGVPRPDFKRQTQLVYEVTPTGLKQYIGDIKQFLHEKHAASITAYEAKKTVKVERSKKDKSPVKASGGQDYKARKAHEKALRKAKNAVDRHEKNVASLENCYNECPNGESRSRGPHQSHRARHAYEAVQNEMQEASTSGRKPWLRWKSLKRQLNRLTRHCRAVRFRKPQCR